MACESQITGTLNNPTSKLTDAQKMRLVEFQNGLVMTAQSGTVLMSQRFIEIFEELARERWIESDRTVPKTAQEAMLALKKEICAHFGCRPSTINKTLLHEGIKVECMFAYYMETAPFIYTITLYHGIPEPMRDQFVAIGCGDSLAEYLLDSNLVPDIPDNHGALVAINVIETVKKYDSGCSGQTHVSLLKLDREKEEVIYGEFAPEDVNAFAGAYAIAEVRAQNYRNDLMSELMDDWWEEWKAKQKE